MKLGIIIGLDEKVEESIRTVKEYGIPTFQLCGWEDCFFTPAYAERVKRAVEEYQLEISAFWCGWGDPKIWNFYDGPHTLGLVPSEYRYVRMQQLKKGSDFAKAVGITDVATHVGFLPEVPSTAEYTGLVAAIRDVAQHCGKNGQYFLFETGQETPVTLRRMIEDVGTGNLGINLDPANLILYGKGNPIDALDVFGEYVRGVHGKDGFYPTNGRELGMEAKVGEGKVDYPRFIRRLKEVGYDGTITIEREISGEQQIQDIKDTIAYLGTLID